MTVGVRVRCARCAGSYLRDACITCGHSPAWEQEAARTREVVAAGELPLSGGERSNLRRNDGLTRQKARQDVARRESVRMIRAQMRMELEGR
jgi:hypothetical protein